MGRVHPWVGLGQGLENGSNWWKILTLTPTPMLEVFSLNQIADVGAPRSKDCQLISRKIIFELFQPMWSRYLNVTDGQTDDLA